MSFKFPYQYGFIGNRKIPYPIVKVYLQTTRGLRAYSFIMDTGADDLTLPEYMIILLGLKKKDLQESESQGISKKPVKTWEGIINITFCKKTFPVPCSFTNNNKTPFLLGKEGIFDKFNIMFDNNKDTTIFYPKM